MIGSDCLRLLILKEAHMIGFVVDFRSNGVPKYIQLYDYIKKEIEAGNLKNGEKLDRKSVV